MEENNQRNNTVKSKKKKRRYSKGTVRCCAFLIFVSLCAIILSAYQTTTNNAISTKGKKGLSNLNLEHTSKSEKVAYFLVCGVDDSKTLTDVIMVVMFDIEKQAVKVMQIPRDTYIGGGKGIGQQSTKINAVYGKGQSMDWCGKCKKNVLKSEVNGSKHTVCGKDVSKNSDSGVLELIKVVNEQFGIPVDHYVTFTIEGFKNSVDAVGGVEVDVPKYSEYHGKSIKKGVQTLNGDKAEILFRYRELSGDIGRMEAQRQLWSGVAVKILDMTQVEFATTLLPKVYKEVSTDMTISELRDYKIKADKIRVSDIEYLMIPGEGLYANEVSYYSVHLNEYIELFNEKFIPYGTAVTDKKISAYQLSGDKPKTGSVSQIESEDGHPDISW